MAQILVRGLRPEIIERWRARAKRNNRSLEAEIRQMIESQAGPDPHDRAAALRFADEMRAKYAGRITGNSADIIREERERR